MMIRKPITSRTRFFFHIFSVILLLIGYSLLSNHQHAINPADNTIPSLAKIGNAIIHVMTPNPRSHERWLVTDTKATFFRLAIAFSVAVSASVVLGLLIGCFTRFEAFCEWPLSFFGKITPTGALAVFFALFGTDTKMFIAMIVFGILPAMTQSIVIAIKQFPEELQNKGYTIGFSTGEMVLSLIARYVLPNIIDAIKACIGPAMIFLIAAEMLCADAGFGYRIRMQSRLLNMDVVYIYLSLLAVFGFLADFVLKTTQRKLCAWYTKENK